MNTEIILIYLSIGLTFAVIYLWFNQQEKYPSSDAEAIAFCIIMGWGILPFLICFVIVMWFVTYPITLLKNLIDWKIDKDGL